MPLRQFGFMAAFAVAQFGADAAAQSVTRIVVSTRDQAFVAFAGDQVVLRGPVSTGKNNLTPLGDFRVSDKHEDHISNIYHMPMPYFMRLSGRPEGLHKGYLPGRPDSHGCIRLTGDHAQRLFYMTPVGTRVTVTGVSTAATAGVEQPKAGEQAENSYYRVVNGRRFYMSDRQAAAYEAKRKATGKELAAIQERERKEAEKRVQETRRRIEEARRAEKKRQEEFHRYLERQRKAAGRG